MLTDTLQKIAQLRAQAAALEAEIETARAKELAALPANYGFESAAAFVAAVTAAAGIRGGRKTGKARVSLQPAGKKRRKRAVITAETKAEVKKLANAGKTGAEIANAVGISPASVQNIKKALNLVKKAKK